jgi:penicillin-binding protein 2
VALAVVVENAGFGSEAAAPIARRVFDYLLLGLVPSEEDMAATRKGQSGAPIGTQRRAAEMPLPGQAAAVSASASAAAPARAEPGAPAPQRLAVAPPVGRGALP